MVQSGERGCSPELIAIEVDDRLREMIEQFPLPVGVKDADCNQEEIAQALNTTVTSVAKWIKADGMPVVQAGGNGRAYVLRLSHCWAWRKAQQADLDMRAQHNKAQITALQASFLNVTVDDPQAAMTPQQRKEAALADIAWSKAQHLRKQLVPLGDVVGLYESIFQIVRDGIEALPDRLERELGLTPGQVAAVVRAGEDILRGMVDRVKQEELAERDVPDVEVQERWLI